MPGLRGSGPGPDDARREELVMPVDVVVALLDDRAEAGAADAAVAGLGVTSAVCDDDAERQPVVAMLIAHNTEKYWRTVGDR